MRKLICTGVVVGLACLAQGFPPAPSYTIFGFVRDQVGQVLDVAGAQLILLKGAAEVGRVPINQGALLDQNYEMAMRIDSNLSGVAYSSKAIFAQSPYSLAVEMNGLRFYPIEVAGNLTTGKGGERVRLDLNLGEDTDLDGLPDVWEQWQLYQAGYLPDGNGNWPLHLIDRNGDFDNDGRSNWLEYVAGTFAGDAEDKFDLQIKEKLEGSVRFEFYGITGKTYALEESSDATNWSRLAFSIGALDAGSQAYRASDVGILSAYVAAGSDKKFYRLTVR